MLLKCEIFVNYYAKVSYIFATLQRNISSNHVRERSSVSKFGSNVDHFGFSFIKAESIVKGPDLNIFKATAKFPSRFILLVWLQSYINLSVIGVHHVLNALVRIDDL